MQYGKFFIISLHYQVALSEVEKYLEAHRRFLDLQYDKHVFIASGPKNPRTGGVIIARYLDKNELVRLLQDDPFYKEGIASYEITEFTPTTFSEEFKAILDKDCAN